MTIISRYLPRFRRSVIAPRFLRRLKQSQTVVGGPFKGIRYDREAVAATHSIMGVYESELTPWILKWSAIPFRHIINVGASEGYYAVGCAMLWPQATVTAFECSEERRRLLTRNVELNGLQSRVKIMGHCGEEQLDGTIVDGHASLVIMDVEGAEGGLLNPGNVPGLANAHIIVEIHDYIDNRLGEIVSSYLKSSHVIKEVQTQRRTFWDFHEPRALWLRLWLLPYLKQYANELRPGPMRWFCCTPIAARSHMQPCSQGAVRHPETCRSNSSKRPTGAWLQHLVKRRPVDGRVTAGPPSSFSAQRNALARKFALGLLRPFTGLSFPVRVGEIAQTILSHWPIPPQPAKPIANFCYLAVSDRTHWLMLRESLFSLHRSWNSLPQITVVSDGSWTADEFLEVFAWWPTPITVLTRQEVCQAASGAGFQELADYARESLYGLKLAAIVTEANQKPVLFVDADILWFRDPALLLGDQKLWEKPRALQENNCHQRRDMALRHCSQVLESPFVNSGIVALHGELMAPELLRSMVQQALPHPKDSRCEQTIIATAVKLRGEFLPEKLSLVAFDDIHTLFIRNMQHEGHRSRHYVTPVRQLFYRDALKLRFQRL